MNYSGSKINVIPPTQLKLSYTGSGTSWKMVGGKKISTKPKELMLERFIKEFPGFHESGKIDDVIDAYALTVHHENLKAVMEERKRIAAEERLAKKEKKEKKAPTKKKKVNLLEELVKN